MPAKMRPPLLLLVAVAILSAAILGFEVALTRVFAVLLRYHFAFLVISIAVCGLGVGGYVTYWARKNRTLSLANLAVLFALSIVVALALMLRVVFAFFPEAYWLAAVLVLIPFSLGGAFLSEVFARFSLWSGRLYAWDLAGAAVMAFAVVGVLQFLSAIDACLLMATLAAFAGVLASRIGEPSAESNAEMRRGNDAILIGVAILAFIGLNVKFHFLDIPAIPPHPDADKMTLADRNMTQPLFTELGTSDHSSKIVDTRWSAFARTDVVDDKSMPGSFYLYTNGNVPTNMMQWDGKMGSIGPITEQFPLSDWAFSVAPFRRGLPLLNPGNDMTGGSARSRGVLAIGPGGGLDALLALHYGAQKFDGAEINPSIVSLMKEPKYAKFNGDLYRHPKVDISVADGRAFVREAVSKKHKYALLFSALTKTATAGQGMALLESFVYTSDAFADYLDVLRDDGQMTIVLDNPMLTARFFATALQVLQSRGVKPQDAMRQIAIVYEPQPGQPYVYALVIQKTAFTRAQTFELEDAAIKRGLTPVWIPNQAQIDDFGPYSQVASGALDLDGFVNFFRDLDNPIDIAPCPDSRPFVLDLTLETLPVFKQLTIFALVLALGVLALSWRTSTGDNALEVSEAALSGLTESRKNELDILYVLYFLALGVGFMLVEIPLTQKLILPLGYPTLALTVILFSILLGGGAGAWFSQRFDDEKLRRHAIICSVGVAAATVVGVMILQAAGSALLQMNILSRCIAIAILILPLGFLLGTPFPSGLRLFAAGRENKVPLIWGLNGVASVVGSLLAAMGAKNFGFNVMLGIGAAMYILAGIILASTRNVDPALEAETGGTPQ